MTTLKAIALAGLVLALAVLSPASALAKPKGTDRPLKATISGTVSLTVATGVFTSDASGESSHLGKYTVHLQGQVGPTPQGTYAGSGSITWVAANGDELTGTFDLSTDRPPPAPHTTTLEIAIKGGTGRFADASGTATATTHVAPLAFDGVTLLNSVEGTATGKISY
jgi:hypothetical protein